ncbi:MAG: hypothetical protein AAGK32_14065, partial [Actinomycetota bacterium]
AVEPDFDPAATPEFEITDPSIGAVRYLEHGYPSSLIRWHCHNEFELHFIVASSGKAFVGDYIGPFRAGHLVPPTATEILKPAVMIGVGSSSMILGCTHRVGLTRCAG